MKLRVGERLRSAVDSTEVVVIRAGGGDVALTCGGVAMIGLESGPAASSEEGRPEPLPGHDGGTQLGKRYADADALIELLCTKSGPGALFADGEPMSLKQAKSLPASD